MKIYLAKLIITIFVGCAVIFPIIYIIARSDRTKRLVAGIGISLGLLVALFGSAISLGIIDGETMIRIGKAESVTDIGDVIEFVEPPEIENDQITNELLDGTMISELGDRIVLSSQKYIKNDWYSDGHILVGHGVHVVDGEQVHNEWKNGRVDISGSDYMFLNIHIENDNPNENIIAKNTSVYFDVPEGVNNNMVVVGHVTASNADPMERTDEIEIVADRKFSLEYVNGTAYMYNNYYSFKSIDLDPQQRLGDRIIEKPGAHVGYKSPDGLVKGGPQYQVNVSIMLNINWE